MRVLAVDDSELALQVYKLFLSLSPDYKTCTLVTAHNGREALDILQSESGIEVVLLDLNMPLMNGLELLAAMQKDPHYQEIPVIMVSTQGREEDMRRALKMGAKAYLTKPFQAHELHALIGQVTNR
jgi:CheY-like chemotaxis protein